MLKLSPNDLNNSLLYSPPQSDKIDRGGPKIETQCNIILETTVEGFLLLITTAIQYLVAISINTKKYFEPHIFKSVATTSLNFVARGIATIGRHGAFLNLLQIEQLEDTS